MVRNFNIQHLKGTMKAKTNQRILLVEKKRNNIIEKETHLSFQNSKSVGYEKILYFYYKLSTLMRHVFVGVSILMRHLLSVLVSLFVASIIEFERETRTTFFLGRRCS